MTRLGMTIPIDGFAMTEQATIGRDLESLGYTDVWSSEAMGADAFTPLTVVAGATTNLRLGTAIASVYARGPACLAQTAATLAATVPDRLVVGVGSSSQIIVEQWNDRPFDRPYQRTLDTVRFLKKAFAGERVDEDFETFGVHGFRLGVVPPIAPPILVAALRSKMLRMAGEEADGAIINWLSASDVAVVAPIVRAGGAGKEIVARIMVVPTSDTDLARSVGRRMVSTYLTVPVYRAFHEWLGRTDLLADTWSLWSTGDRKGATAAVPDAVVDDLIIYGTPHECRVKVQRYVEEGVTTPVLALLPLEGVDTWDYVRALAPNA
jgi:probable F420-dependent oxidoreductase